MELSCGVPHIAVCSHLKCARLICVFSIFLSRLKKETERTKLIIQSLSGLLHSQPALSEHIPALGPLPRILRLLSSSSNSTAPAAGGLLNLLNHVAGSSTCVEALARLECIGPIAGAIRHHPEHTAIGLEALEKIISSGCSGAEELAQQAVQVDLVPQLLTLLEESINPHLTPSGRALVVSILKALANSRVQGTKVTSLLDQSPCWASYRDQRHDLFLQASGSALQLTGSSSGVAGYITHTRAPAGMARQAQAPPPPPPTDPLQSRDEQTN